MKPPFNVLNEQPSSADLLRGPPASPSMLSPDAAPLGSAAASGSAPKFEPAVGGGVFGGAGAFDSPAEKLDTQYIPLAGDPPDVGHETRQLLWQRGVTPPQAAPATLDRFCCLTGPCRHYSEIHVDEPDTLPERRVRIIRLCRHHADDDGGTLEMSEGTIPACVTYEPPWWSLDGWRMKLIVAFRVSRTLVRISHVNDMAIWRKLVEWRVLPKDVVEDPNYGIE